MPERRPELSLHDWAVLGVLAGGESHGFAVAKELAPHGEVGRVWTVSRPQVYRSLDRLVDLGLVEPVERQPGDAGPDRTVLAATARGHDRLRRWLGRPVAHLRDVRSELLVKLLLAERLGVDARPLVEAQRAAFAPRLDALAAANVHTDGVVDAWRHESADAVRRFLDRLDR
ncbi:MAG TPA: PadR family transcriptional regulator [Acidimicrobiales bacterium]|nr:PadR family transcriptional regulator [Acidimicrobiales bacterium]